MAPDALMALRSLPATTPELLLHARCALQQGYRAVALLALQRILVLDPENIEANKLHDELSRTRSESSQETSSSPHVLLHKGWIALEAGQDSNINSGTSSAEIQTPYLNTRKLSLNNLLVAQPSGFVGVSADTTLYYPWTNASYLYAGLQASARYNTSRYVHLPHNYGMSAGITNQSGRFRFSAELSASQNWLAGYKLLNAQTLKVQTRIAASEMFHLSLFATTGNNHYPQYGNTTTTEKSYGMTASHLTTQVELTVFGGNESTTGTIRDLARRYDGFLIDYRLPLGRADNIDFRYSQSSHRHPEYSLLFLAYRQDLLKEFVMQYRHNLDKNWTISPRITLQDNASTIPLTRYRRNEYLLELRRNF